MCRVAPRTYFLGAICNFLVPIPQRRVLGKTLHVLGVKHMGPWLNISSKGLQVIDSHPTLKWP